MSICLLIHIYIHTHIRTSFTHIQTTDVEQLRRARAIAQQKKFERDVNDDEEGSKTQRNGESQTDRNHKKKTKNIRVKEPEDDIRSAFAKRVEKGRGKRVRERGGYTFEMNSNSDASGYDSSSESVVTEPPSTYACMCVCMRICHMGMVTEPPSTYACVYVCMCICHMRVVTEPPSTYACMCVYVRIMYVCTYRDVDVWIMEICMYGCMDV
jgi:hypothetical protein